MTTKMSMLTTMSKCVEVHNEVFFRASLHLDLNRCAAFYSAHASQSTNDSTRCTRECALLLGSGNALRESSSVRVHVAAGLQNRPPISRSS
jgi:hypothetical protein